MAKTKAKTKAASAAQVRQDRTTSRLVGGDEDSQIVPGLAQRLQLLVKRTVGKDGNWTAVECACGCDRLRPDRHDGREYIYGHRSPATRRLLGMVPLYEGDDPIGEDEIEALEDLPDANWWLGAAAAWAVHVIVWIAVIAAVGWFLMWVFA